MRRVHWAATEVMVNLYLAKLIISLFAKFLIFLCAATPMSLLMQEERVHWRRPVIFVLLQFLSFIRVSARIRFGHFVMAKNVKSLLSELGLLASFVLGRARSVAAFSPAGRAKGRVSGGPFSLHPLFCTACCLAFLLVSSCRLLQATGLRDR